MGARQKLNQAYAAGSFILAAAAGFLTGSIGIFVLILIILLALNVVGGEIRTNKRNW
jgi:hypothetical protein